MKEIVKIEKLDHNGRGIGFINNKIIFINKAVPGDEVEVEIILNKKNYSEGKVIRYINKSNLRNDNFCKYSDICGGCNLLLIYKEQLKYKEDKIKNIINKYLKEDIKVNDIIFSNDIFYRNKISLHVKGNKLGLYEKETNKLVKIDECKLVNNNINSVIKRLKEYLKIFKSNVREIIIKSTTLNETMIIIYGTIDRNKFIKNFQDINSIILNNYVIHGTKYIKEKINNYTFLISQNSFFQVNNYNVNNLYNEVIKKININYKKALDLYCGTGTIGISISKYAKEVIGIEVVKDAIDDANKNKKINNINNINFINGKVEDNLDKIQDADLIIVDPPREGLDKKVTETILKILPKDIIYVSCDPMTLIRDLNLLKEKYIIKELTPVDMFPNTYHVETVSVLERKSIKK